MSLLSWWGGGHRPWSCFLSDTNIRPAVWLRCQSREPSLLFVKVEMFENCLCLLNPQWKYLGVTSLWGVVIFITYSGGSFFSPCSHTPLRVRANVFTNLQAKTAALSLSRLFLPPPSHWTPGWCLTEPWMLFDCPTFPNALQLLLLWPQKDGSFLADPSRLPPLPGTIAPNSNRLVVRERVPNNGWWHDVMLLMWA